MALALVAVAARVETWRREAPALPPAEAAIPPTAVLLPVRDEESNVVPCVEALLALRGSPHVVVIDDGSTDRTRALLEEVAQRESRLQVQSAGPLPPGWRGKINALDGGLAQTTEPWLLLTDADARHAPDLLVRAHAAAVRWRLDAVSIAGTQEARGFGEQFLVPAVFALLDFILGDWSAAADSQGAAVANGQFILVRREALLASGGFAALRRPAIDDVALAQELRRHGFRTGFLRAPALLRIRMYAGLGAALSGWRRNLGGIFGPSPWLAAPVTGVLLAAPLLLAVCAGTASWPAFWLLWTGGAAASASLRLGSDHSPWAGLLFPLDSVLLALLVARGALDFRRGRLASWKGRVVDIGDGPVDDLPSDQSAASSDSKAAR